MKNHLITDSFINVNNTMKQHFTEHPNFGCQTITEILFETCPEAKNLDKTDMKILEELSKSFLLGDDYLLGRIESITNDVVKDSIEGLKEIMIQEKFKDLKEIDSFMDNAKEGIIPCYEQGINHPKTSVKNQFSQSVPFD